MPNDRGRRKGHNKHDSSRYATSNEEKGQGGKKGEGGRPIESGQSSRGRASRPGYNGRKPVVSPGSRTEYLLKKRKGGDTLTEDEERYLLNSLGPDHPAIRKENDPEDGSMAEPSLLEETEAPATSQSVATEGDRQSFETKPTQEEESADGSILPTHLRESVMNLALGSERLSGPGSGCPVRLARYMSFTDDGTPQSSLYLDAKGTFEGPGGGAPTVTDDGVDWQDITEFALTMKDGTGREATGYYILSGPVSRTSGNAEPSFGSSQFR